jgi:hypothetical protein
MATKVNLTCAKSKNDALSYLKALDVAFRPWQAAYQTYLEVEYSLRSKVWKVNFVCLDGHWYRSVAELAAEHLALAVIFSGREA